MERILTINLSSAYKKPTIVRARRAILLLKEFIAKHTKTEEGKIRISQEVNDLIWSSGMKKPIKKIRVKVVTDEAGAHVLLPEEEMKKEEKPEKKVEKKEKPKEEEKKEEKTEVEIKEEKAKKEMIKLKKE